MKTLMTILATLSVLTGSQVAQAMTVLPETELVFFTGYNGPNDYETREVSSLFEPLPSEYLTADPVFKVALCFEGPVYGVMAIIEEMIVDNSNLEVVVGWEYAEDNSSVGAPAMISGLTIRERLPHGNILWQLNKVRPCDRTSVKR